MTTSSVVLANISPGKVTTPFTRSLVEYVTHPPEGVRHVASILATAGPYLDIERNKVMEQLSEIDEWDCVLWVDDDISFTPDDVAKVAHACTPETPVVCGAYKSVNNDGTFIVAYRDERNDRDERFTALTQADLDAPGPELLEIGGAGTGFMCIHRTLVEEMPLHYAQPQVWFGELNIVRTDGGGWDWIGEDLIFCLRAQQLGHPVLLHREVRLGHFKTIGLSCARENNT